MLIFRKNRDLVLEYFSTPVSKHTGRSVKCILIQFDENFSLFQLREEFGYDVNPHDPAFAEKIAEKEREIAKRVKDEKKQKKKDSKEAHMAKMAEESSKS